jgi:long-chain acyl-CoA synthetase
MRRDIFGIVPGIRSVVPGPLYHSAPNAFAMRAGRVGEVMVLMPRFDPVALLELIERERLDTMFMVPTMFIRLLKLPEDVRRRYDLSSLRFVIHAAAPCPHEVKRAMIDWWGPVISEFYGSTESSAVTLASSADTLAKPGTVGRAVEGAELRILDDDGRILPAGARSSRVSPSCPTSPTTTGRTSVRRSIARASSPRATLVISMRTAISSCATASATW